MWDFKLQRDEETVAPEPARIHDMVIIGGGPAGLAAGLYAARARLDVLLVEKGELGGQAAITDYIENCPGCLEGSGAEFIGYLKKQALKFGLEVTHGDILDVKLAGEVKTIATRMGVLRARTVILAPGAFSRKLNVPGEDTFRGKGVSFCSTCDAPFYKDKVVAVIGGGDSAVQEGLFTARFAARVFLIHRRDTLRATRIIQEKALANPIVEIRLNTVVEGILGDQRVRALALRNMRTGEKSELSVDGVFIYVGMQPNTNFLVGKVSLDPDGYVITNERMQTNLPGVFAAGDVRRTPLRQVVTAMSDGAIAATYADRYLSGEE